MNPVEVKAEIAKAFSKLGNSANEVHSYLASRGIKGQAYEAKRCPIANFLKKEVPSLTTVSVSSSGLCASFPGGTIDTDVPKAVANFIWAFDQGSYFFDLREG